MAIYKFPSNDDQEKEKVKKPEFIVIDEPEEEMQGAFWQNQFLLSLQDLKDIRIPFYMRFVALLFSLFSFVFSFFALVALGFWVVVAALGLFKVHFLNAPFLKIYALLKKILVILIGSTTAIFNPIFGIGIVVLYYMLLGEDLGNTVLKRFKTFTNGPNN